MAFTLVPVAGTYVDSAGLPARGTVTFTPTSVMRNGSSTSRGAVTYTLTTAGALPSTAKLAATTAAGTTPTGVTYRVDEVILPNGAGAYLDSKVTATYYIPVDHAATSIDLAVEATDADPDEPELYQRVTQRGAADGYAPLDSSAKVPVANLPAAALDGLPSTGGELTGSLRLVSSPAGGDNTFDSTSRLELESYQTGGTNDYGESIRIALRGDHAKGMIAWDDGWSTPQRVAAPKSIVWMGAHYGAQQVDADNPPGTVHGHWSIEVPGVDQALRTRFEILFVDPATNTIGVDNTIIRTGGADLIVTANEGNAFRVAGANEWNKDIVFTNQRDRGDALRRWVVRANNTTDDGSQNGSDFEILRQTTTTDLLTALFIKRSTGRVGLGGNRAPLAVLHIPQETADVPLIRLEPTVAMNQPMLYAQSTTNQDRVISGRVVGDTIDRTMYRVDGKLEWGPGTTARDTVLWRVGVGVLRTENTFDAVQNLRLGITTTAPTAGVAGGVGVIAMANATTAPTSNPSGGVVLYSEGGLLKVRTPSGVFTVNVTAA